MFILNVSVNSKRDHPPPPGNPRAFDFCSAPHSGAFDANRSPTHRAFDPSKKCWPSSRVKRILYSMSQVITPRGFRWLAISSVLLYVEICHYRKYGIFRKDVRKAVLASTFEEFVSKEAVKPFVI